MADSCAWVGAMHYLVWEYAMSNITYVVKVLVFHTDKANNCLQTVHYNGRVYLTWIRGIVSLHIST